MHNVDEYLQQTESATRALFTGIATYTALLKAGIGPMFMPAEQDHEKSEEAYRRWQHENQAQLLHAARQAVVFLHERFALSTLCGAVLQIAEKGLEMYSPNDKLPSNAPSLKLKPPQAKFCVGREIRGIPLGLVIYAARNQHTHFNDSTLREPSRTIFQILAHVDGFTVPDPCFDLSNKSIHSFADNITALIDWRSYETYEQDMRAMLAST
ncbi:MAG TPA: hypothetical protein VLC08_06930 [Chitinolyticbacter sp.]|nr:hypothetical protein [Chitinolyticbacter sp.]